MNMPELNMSLPLSGGDPLAMDINAPYQATGYHMTWIMASTAIIWPIIPGIGLLYGGLARRKSALALLWQSFLVSATISIQWWFVGYTLTYSRTAGPFIGDFRHTGLRHVVAAPSPGSGYIPEILFALFQVWLARSLECFFCAATVQIVIGGAFERGRLFPSLVFGFIWATVVYSPVACWTWNSNGWLFNLPSLDYAGGGPVHIASGFGALAYALVLGKRKGIGSAGRPRPHNVTMVFIGTILIWFGWLCFNGGSTFNATVRSMYAMFNTNIAASTGMVGWVATDYFRKGRKYSLVGSCEGVICGLVGITPCAGFVSVWYAAVIGFVTSVCCAWLDVFTDWINIDEGLDVFRLHGLGGIVGSFLTGVFADHTYSMLDGMTDARGSVNGNGIQIAYQLAGIAAISSYSFVVSAIILLVMKYIPGLSVRVDEIMEIDGLDTHAFYMEEVGDWSAVQEEENILRVLAMNHLGTPPMQNEERVASKSA